jgi:hypothetical protein
MATRLLVRVLVPVMGTAETSDGDVIDLGCVSRVREQVAQRVQHLLPSSKDRRMWVRFVSALWTAYDELGMEGALSTHLMSAGVGVRVHLPDEMFGAEKQDAIPARITGARIIHLYFDAWLWKTMMFELIHVAFEAAFVRVIVALLRPSNPSAYVQDVCSSRLVRLPTALITHVANQFLADADAQALARCNTIMCIALRRSYLLKHTTHFVDHLAARHAHYAFYWQPTGVFMHEYSRCYDLSRWTRLIHVTLDDLSDRWTSICDTLNRLDSLTSLELQNWQPSSAHALRFPPGILCLSIGFSHSFDIRSHPVIWPANLHTLTMSGYYRFRGVTLPQSLCVLRLGVKLGTPYGSTTLSSSASSQECLLPSTLIRLELLPSRTGPSANEFLTSSLLPLSLQCLSIRTSKTPPPSDMALLAKIQAARTCLVIEIA